ncbi:MAG TPA: DUF2087 domain-containing protein [Actinopolymorphaceae bacterium]
MDDVILRRPSHADAETQKVYRAFVRDGRIATLPARRSKRRVLLELVVLLFEPGVRYDEADVNRTLMALHDDYVALRRHLVDEHLLERDHGTYWRIGGAVQV